MVSITPSDSLYNTGFTKMKEKYVHPTSLLGIIQHNTDFSLFYNLVKKVKYEDKLSDLLQEFTLFIPSDTFLRKKYTENYLCNITESMSRQILSFSMIKRKIDRNLLQSTSRSIYQTLDASNSLKIITCNGTTFLNNSTSVICWDYVCDNGIIHVIDNILVPD